MMHHATKLKSFILQRDNEVTCTPLTAAVRRLQPSKALLGSGVSEICIMDAQQTNQLQLWLWLLKWKAIYKKNFDKNDKLGANM